MMLISSPRVCKRIDKHFVTDQIRADGRSEGLLEVTPYAGWEQGFTRDLWIPFRLSERSNDYVAFDLRNEPETVMNGLIAMVESNGALGYRFEEASRRAWVTYGPY